LKAHGGTRARATAAGVLYPGRAAPIPLGERALRDDADALVPATRTGCGRRGERPGSLGTPLVPRRARAAWCGWQRGMSSVVDDG